MGGKGNGKMDGKEQTGVEICKQITRPFSHDLSKVICKKLNNVKNMP
jgi:hypothetical protein